MRRRASIDALTSLDDASIVAPPYQASPEALFFFGKYHTNMLPLACYYDSYKTTPSFGAH